MAVLYGDMRRKEMIQRASKERLKQIKDFWENWTANEGYRSPGFEKKGYFNLVHPELVDKHFHNKAEKTIFEVGCGWGKQTKLFSKMFKHVIASDISPTIISFAKERCSEEKNITYCEYPNDLKNLNFDCLFSYGTMQYCTDGIIVAMLEDILPFMNKNGRFLLEFQMFDAIREKQKLNEGNRVDIMRNPHEIKHILEQVGLKCEGYELVLTPVLQVWIYGHKG